MIIVTIEKKCRNCKFWTDKSAGLGFICSHPDIINHLEETGRLSSETTPAVGRFVDNVWTVENCSCGLFELKETRKAKGDGE